MLVVLMLVVTLTTTMRRRRLPPRPFRKLRYPLQELLLALPKEHRRTAIPHDGQTVLSQVIVPLGGRQHLPAHQQTTNTPHHIPIINGQAANRHTRAEAARTHGRTDGREADDDGGERLPACLPACTGKLTGWMTCVRG